VKDGAGGRVDVMAAVLTGIGAPLAHGMESSRLLAAGAADRGAAVVDFHELGEAGGVVRVFGLKLLESVLGHDFPRFRREQTATCD
jgi:hypothetical protein